jgi:hypothetical protein
MSAYWSPGTFPSLKAGLNRIPRDSADASPPGSGGVKGIRADATQLVKLHLPGRFRTLRRVTQFTLCAYFQLPEHLLEPSGG